MSEITIQGPTRLSLEVSGPVTTDFPESENPETETIFYSGSELGLRLRVIGIRTDKIETRLSLLGHTGRELPRLFDEDTQSYVTNPELSLTHKDIGLEFLFGPRLGDKSVLGFTGSLALAKFATNPENSSGTRDRYGNFEDPNDQGGFPIPGAPLNNIHTQGLSSTARLGLAVEVEIFKGLFIGGGIEYSMSTLHTEEFGDQKYNKLGVKTLFGIEF